MFIKSLFRFSVLSFLFFLVSTASIYAQDFIMQGWYWDYPKTANGYLWADTVKSHAADLKNSGFTYVWLPPLSRASFGSTSNGYDPKDLYDLGDYGLGATGFGTRADVDALITQFNNVGLKAVADVVYNHRDGGNAENNPALKNYIDNYNWNNANSVYNPFPYDRYRVVLPIGGATGNVAGDYYFKISSSSAHSRFDNYEYRVYIQTDRKGWQSLSNLTESEPNGGGDCAQANNNFELGRNMDAINEDYLGCRTDEFHLSLTSDDFYSSGDAVYIYFNNRNSGYSDMRIYGVWSGPRSANIVNELIYQTYTDFTNMPSGLGAMNYENFKPNSTNSTKLDGDWDWPWFFYDYDQNVPATNTALIDWTKWLWNDVGIRGLRMDAVKHFPPEFVGDLLDDLHSNGIDPNFVVGEFYDANAFLLKNWIDDVYSFMEEPTKLSIALRVYDFSLREALEKSSDQFGYDVRNVFSSSIVDAQGLSGTNVITFANNHDFRDAGQPIDNDPILAYAYLLTNNQIGLPCVYYPDYYKVTGYTNSGMKSKIDELINVHRDYIYGSSARDYLTKFGTIYNPIFSSGFNNTTLVYQLMGTPSGKDVIVAINYAGVALDMWIGVNMTGVSEGTIFGDQIGNGLLPTITVSGGRVNVQLPARSYSVWVENESPVPVELVSFSTSILGSSVLLNWQTATEVNNYGFEIERSTPLNPLSRGEAEGRCVWENIGFIEGNGTSNSPKDYSFTDASVVSGKYSYRLKQIDNDGQFEYSKIIEVDLGTPKKYEISQNYPNPFNPNTVIKFSLPEAGNVKLTVYNLLGQEVKIIVNGIKEAGTHIINFNAEALNSGVYIYRIESKGFNEVMKMTLIK